MKSGPAPSASVKDGKNEGDGGTKPRRGRPREFDRDEALDRALDVFWRWGYEAASLAMLTEAMKITPPSLYSAFGSKEELFFEAMKRYGARHALDIPATLAAGRTAREGVEAVLFGAAQTFTEPGTPGGCFVISAAQNCSPSSIEIQEKLRKGRANGEAAIRARIARGIEEGDLPKDVDVATLAKHVATVFQGMSVQARDGATHDELLRVATFAMQSWPEGPAPQRKRRRN